MTSAIVYFWRVGDRTTGYLTQWYRSKFTDPASGLTFNCAEQWMMWSKARLMRDENAEREIMRTSDPRSQKQLGRTVKNFDEAAWDRVKLEIVEQGNYLRFKSNADLRRKLLATGDAELVEASPFDRIWGIGFKEEDASSHPRSEWGENLLGKALMNVRDRLRQEESA